MIVCIQDVYTSHYSVESRYNFNISIYRLNTSLDLLEFENNAICLLYKGTNKLGYFNYYQIGKGDWEWPQSENNREFSLILPPSEGIKVQMMQYSLSEEKSLQNYNFRIIVQDIRDENDKKNRRKNLLYKDLIFPGSSIYVWHFQSDMRSLYFMVLGIIREDIVHEVPYYIIIKKVKPLYPVWALRNRIEGDVIIQVESDIMGRMINIKKVIGHPL